MAQPGEAHQPQTSSGSRTQQEWLEELYSYVQKGGKQPVRLAIQALNAYPTNGELLLVTALAALIEERPDQSLRYQKRFSKHFLPSVDLLLLQALTWAQQSRWGQADRLIKENGLNDLQGIVFYFPFARAVLPWIRGWFRRVEQESGRLQDSAWAERRKPASPKNSARPVAAKLQAEAAPAVQRDVSAEHQTAADRWCRRCPDCPPAERLGLPAEGRLAFGPEFPPRALPVHFDSDWMERFGQVLGQRGRVFRRVLDLTTAPPSDPERLLEHTLVLQNAVYRLLNLVPAWTRYLILTFQYSAVSDEKREGILQLGVNLSNGSPLDSIRGPLLQVVAAPPSGSHSSLPAVALPPLWESRRLHRLIQVALPQRIRHELSPFINSMQRRLERDMARLYEYYNDLHRESFTRLRKKVTDSSQSFRLETISREYQAKVADLRQKFALRIEVGWVQTLELILPVHRFELILKRRKGQRRFHLDWNPLVRKLEQPPCEYSFTWESGRLICDDALHLVSIAAHAECPQCGKPYCRACHAEKCPRCTSQPHA